MNLLLISLLKGSILLGFVGLFLSKLRDKMLFFMKSNKTCLNLFLISILVVPGVINASMIKNNVVVQRQKIENNVVATKFLLRSSMISPEIAFRTEEEADFISHITALVGNEFVIDMSTSTNLAKNPYFKFIFKNTPDNRLTTSYIVTDNKGKKRIKSFRGEKTIDLKNVTIPNSLNLNVVDPNIWKVTSIDDAINVLYPSMKDIKEGKVTLWTPDTVSVEMDSRIPVEINFDVELESFAIFSDFYKNPTVAIVSTPLRGMSKFQLGLSMLYGNYARTYKIVIVGKDKKGIFYKAEKHIEINY